MKRVSFLKRQEGQAAAEMALVLPVFLLIIMAIITFGMIIYVKTLVVISASQAAKVGAYLYLDDTLTDEEKNLMIRSTANTLLSNGISGIDRTVTIITDGSTEITVIVLYNYKLILPLLGDILGARSVIPLQYSCTYMIQ